MKNDYPDVDYKVVSLPAGPTGEATLQYTNCWGIAAQSDNIDGAKSLVEHLTTPGEQQSGIRHLPGVMPSVEEVADEWKAKYLTSRRSSTARTPRRTCPHRRRPTSSPR